MEPLFALSLAASVAQFIDFGSKLVVKSKEIAENGSSVLVSHLSLITQDLVAISSSLEQQLKSRKAPEVQLIKEEQVSTSNQYYIELLLKSICTLGPPRSHSAMQRSSSKILSTV